MVALIEPVAKGNTVRYPDCKQSVVAIQDMPIHHEIAIAEVKKVGNVIRYGENIGVATSDIATINIYIPTMSQMYGLKTI